MHVNVVVFATLRRYVPGLGIGQPLEMDVEPGTTLAEIQDNLGLPENEVRIVMRNGLQAELSDTVQDGDRIAYIPAVAGG